MQRGKATSPARRRRGFTLVEALISMAILAIVLVGAQSAVMIAAKSVPSPTDAVALNAGATSALGRMADDIGVAKAFTVRDATDVEFTVPDRTGDGAADTLRYTWSGTPGDPLVFTLNGGAKSVIAPAIHALTFTYETAQEAQPTTYSEGAETTLYSYTTATSGAARPVGKSSGDTYLRAQYFRPTLPADAVSWSVTKVSFWGRRFNNVDSTIDLQVRTERNGAPTSRLLSDDSFSELSLGFSWTRFDLSTIKVRGLFPSEYVCLVFQPVSGNDCIELLFQRSAATTDSYALSSINGGSSWSTTTDTLVCEIYGRVVRPDPPVVKTVLTGVGYALQPDTNAPAYTGTWPTCTRPEVTP